MVPATRVRTLGALIRWLGPWAGSAEPEGVQRRSWLLREGRPCGRDAHSLTETERAAPPRLEAYVYEARARPLGTYVVVHGLHFAGPDDPRLDRFCRILARSGFRVVAPLLPAYLDLTLAPSVPDDLEMVVRALPQEGPPPTLFSISFGSWPALEVAARLGDAIDAVVTFGGYAQLERAIRFALDGVAHTERGPVATVPDPLNPPVVFLNMLPFLEEATDDAPLLARAWREMTYRTWGRMELKAPGLLQPFAEAIAADVPARVRELFMIGCGVAPGGVALLDRAMVTAREVLAFADPAPALTRLTSPVIICHGRDDDVIPWHESHQLARTLRERVPTRLFITGLYDHTGSRLPSPIAAACEMATLLSMGRALARAGHTRRWLTLETAP